MRKWDQANCYGYAVGVNRWLASDCSYGEKPEDLLERNDSWKQVSKSDMVLGKSYVAYRYGYFDFHYMFRDHKGHWTHKQGTWPVAPISQREVFKNSWKGGSVLYTSRVYLYEVPNR